MAIGIQVSHKIFVPFRVIPRRLMDFKISLDNLNKLLQYKCYNFDKIISGGNKFGINTKVHGTRDTYMYLEITS